MNTVIIKFGGSVLEELPSAFYQDVVKLQESKEWQPIIVHGGGPLITQMLSDLAVETTFVNGMRKTTSEVLDVVEMVLSGKVNKQVVRNIKQAGGRAIGISGVDGDLLQAKQVENRKLGLVGQVESVNKDVLQPLIQDNLIPVISPLGIGSNGERYNINGDIAAAAIAKALGGKLCFVSNIPGIYREENGVKRVLTHISEAEAKGMIEEGVIKEGMIPKIQSAFDALMYKVPKVVILDGTEKDSLISFSEGRSVGTQVVL
ncbi:acetylglutamate kinase [Salinibacillus kushneri]|uniref:Acetylglutamate kinase n=1 Tax=Salinibacillus kushneri TaxID=237682 RepID=A0A1H9Z286_9BACI|nr:acetylglutamate kinase [Salinibacillus kushneri]SES75593.1 acetylglutamate kinase [Salinibacillus kushneri]